MPAHNAKRSPPSTKQAIVLFQLHVSTSCSAWENDDSIHETWITWVHVMYFFNPMINTKESRWNTWELITDLPLLPLRHGWNYQEDWPYITLGSGTCVTKGSGRSSTPVWTSSITKEKSSCNWRSHAQKFASANLVSKACSAYPGEGHGYCTLQRTEWRGSYFYSR